MKQAISFIIILFLASAQQLPAQTGKETFTEVVRVPVSPVKNQQKTGTCWSFATTSFLESEILRNGKGEYDLSEMYFVRFAYLQKAKYFLMFHGKNNFGQGGQAHDVINVIRECGIVPESEYPGNPLTPGILDHSKLEDELRKLITKANEDFNTRKAEKWEKKFDQLLDENMGKIPSEFGIKGQIYTSISFTNYLGIDPDDYVEITSYSHHPFYQRVNLEIPDNWSHDLYINLPIDDLITVIDSALHNGYSVCLDSDISEKGFSHQKGIAQLPNGTSTDQEARQATLLNRQTTDDHLMHIVGISENSKGEKFYDIKNSWGTEQSKYNGFLYLSEPYLQLKTIAIMVNKNAIPKAIMKNITF